MLEVRGSLGIVASSNAEAGHASNEHAVPTQLIGMIAIENQILQLLEQRIGGFRVISPNTNSWFFIV